MQVRFEVKATVTGPALKGTLEASGLKRPTRDARRLAGRATLASLRGATHPVQEAGALDEVEPSAAGGLAEVLDTAAPTKAAHGRG